jgi:hypothetical protein
MTNISDSLSDPIDLNDSDIEKEFNQIKNQKSTFSTGNGNGNANSVNPASTKGPVPGQFNSTTNTAMKTNNFGNSFTVKKSPKPIPKGVDFGQDLIGNPRYFSKNNSPISFEKSNELNSSNSSGNIDNTKSLNTDVYKRLPQYNKGLNQKQNTKNENKSEKDELISDEFSDDDEDDDENDDDEDDFSNDSSAGSSNDESVAKYKGQKKNGEKGNGVFGKKNQNVEYNKYQELTQSEIYARKEELLLELEKLKEKGIRVEKEYDITSDLSEMERTYLRLKNKKDQTAAIKLMKKVLMGLVSGTEYVNQKFNKDNVDLDGWTENVLLNITDYDEIFEELYDKYKTKFAVAPEIKLFMTLFGSAFTFHMSKVLANKFSSGPSFTHNPNANVNNNMNDGHNTNSFEQNDYNNNQVNQGFQDLKMGARNNTNLNPQKKNFTINKPSLVTQNNVNVQNNKINNNNSRNQQLSRNLSHIFNDSTGANKNNDDLDDIIKEMEHNQNQNNLDIPTEDDDGGFNEILSDSVNDFSELNEIQQQQQQPKNLVL